MYMIIVGAGSIGARLIHLAVEEKNNVVVIDSKPERARDVSSQYDVTVLDADATSVDTLREAGAERADALMVTTNDDAVNLMVVSIGVELGVPSVVSVVNEKGHTSFFRRLGASVMENPEEVVAAHLYNAVKRPNVRNFVALTEGAQVFQLEIRAKSILANRTIGACVEKERIPPSLRILALVRDGEKDMAYDGTVLREGDLVTFYALDRVSDDLIKKLTG
ncbi:MAG: TrkA family potassium uptake protein [Candidatus Bipolaricaulota bacterium]